MEPFKKITSVVAPLDRVNVDTDAIIPKQFLKRIERTGFGQFLFYEWRFDENNNPNPNFELNKPRYKGAHILLARNNFGCGSSREHAPWALLDYGFKVIIAPSFADIFHNNCFKNGILPIVLPEETVDRLFRNITETEGYKLTVDLENNKITDEQGLEIAFSVDAYRRECLLKGLDDIGITLIHEDKIAEYEKNYPSYYKIAQ
ncbi:3-isopropylmalate dehydratase small subunit [Aneurinibacillus thermoaerophilus]|uniref:3-isopropylmalate dehydratase small subunit n=1 Tax=Aneurinibacillus TaxID=55079 RepID=UPI00070BD7D5|nr:MULTISPECIES: 3-isopropylmalate dehydratase small subunit [Aneurinibacillus]AMA73272.1 isopropylmalate isomerase [Aneurinibacillus sp. XH2]MED0678312.1 3-isopropylmalate dehydratase small subunit [Aneurinibacillus thermoaerophilus]MED0765825.1 3-isopropylmalate dehydratase small subunit [Aneurinibacillus thermoaerophilus]